MLHTILKIQLWRSFSAKPMCKVTVRPQNMPLSLSLSIDAACPGVSLRTNQPRPTGVTGSSRINSKWCHLSSSIMCPYVHPCVPTFIHASPRTNPVVCFKNKRARQCKTFQRLGNYAAHTSQNTTVEKLCGKTHVQGHNATPEYAALSLSLSIGAACPGVSLTTRQQHPMGVTR